MEQERKKTEGLRETACRDEARYCHNARYGMIRPDAAEEEDDIVSTGQS